MQHPKTLLCTEKVTQESIRSCDEKSNVCTHTHPLPASDVSTTTGGDSSTMPATPMEFVDGVMVQYNYLAGLSATTHAYMST
jgi:hypothetical protein